MLIEMTVVVGPSKAGIFLSSSLFHANSAYTYLKESGSIMHYNPGPIHIMSQKEDNVPYLPLCKAHLPLSFFFFSPKHNDFLFIFIFFKGRKNRFL